ncbi:hypothetical protein BCV72DRAFT_43566 [Rhizopus microsporus var. microsporus]|uniref:Uncharacterized protein n=1 Tax=Rhizopus microsporus var. microsporus TaxID=86635 RepID=A0A1X0RDM5_RHIZD|nr:hypothetical protein BCV72DRAFT_43566 [Rhizopus microsporus var. microsporus]
MTGSLQALVMGKPNKLIRVRKSRLYMQSSSLFKGKGYLRIYFFLSECFIAMVSCPFFNIAYLRNRLHKYNLYWVNLGINSNRK